MGAAEFSANDPVLRALQVAFDHDDPAWPTQGRVLFMGARADDAWHDRPVGELLCQQDSRPFADQLQRHGFVVGDPAPDARFDVVMLRPPRQRDERRAMFARALDHVAPDGVLLAAVANQEGARSAQSDLARLVGPLQHLSKHKCRVFWARPEAASVDADLHRAWQALDVLRPTVEGMVGRPGLFAWDRVDVASALLATHLPADLGGHVADLGAGAGYLSMQLVRRCPGVTALDLFEADARALPAARINLDNACREAGREVAWRVHWHDVMAGLPERFDHVISNPPFHQGRADLPQLGRGFIVAAARALRPGGRFWMVANRHLAYETTLREHFVSVDVRVEEGGFKVIEARQ